MTRRPTLTGTTGLSALLAGLAVIAGALLAGPLSGHLLWLVLLVLVFAALAAGLNAALARRRFQPVEDLIDEMEKVDSGLPAANLALAAGHYPGSPEAERLEAALRRMVRRLETERRRSASAALTAQEKERARVARDLHDQVNQSLTGVLLRLEALRTEAPADLAAEIEATKDLAHQAMAELLTVARQLRPTALDDLGLKAALTGLAGQFEGIEPRVTVAVEGDPAGLDPELQLVIYRVSQEALANAVRHSGAERITISLDITPDEARLEITDDGSGFTYEESTSGLGLGGMRERALLIGGSLETESRPGRGTTIRLVVPRLPADSEPAGEEVP